MSTVRFRDGVGEDAAAWYVEDPEGWREALASHLFSGTEERLSAVTVQFLLQDEARHGAGQGRSWHGGSRSCRRRRG